MSSKKPVGQLFDGYNKQHVLYILEICNYLLNLSYDYKLPSIQNLKLKLPTIPNFDDIFVSKCIYLNTNPGETLKNFEVKIRHAIIRFECAMYNSVGEYDALKETFYRLKTAKSIENVDVAVSNDVSNLETYYSKNNFTDVAITEKSNENLNNIKIDKAMLYMELNDIKFNIDKLENCLLFDYPRAITHLFHSRNNSENKIIGEVEKKYLCNMCDKIILLWCQLRERDLCIMRSKKCIIELKLKLKLIEFDANTTIYFHKYFQ